MLDKARANGASEEAIAQKKAELDKFAELYDNPAINAAITFLEPLPVALIVALVSAGVLSRRKNRASRSSSSAYLWRWWSPSSGGPSDVTMCSRPSDGDAPLPNPRCR